MPILSPVAVYAYPLMLSVTFAIDFAATFHDFRRLSCHALPMPRRRAAACCRFAADVAAAVAPAMRRRDLLRALPMIRFYATPP